jgi:hypothetical protein
MDWPASLIEELTHRRVVIFLGAGASASAADNNGNHPPAWKQLLKDLSNYLPSTATQLARDLVDANQYLDAAQVISDVINPADFNGYIRRVFKEPRYKHTDLHEHINDIDPKVIITTNYDEIYEKYCDSVGDLNSHNVCKYTDDYALNDIRSNTRVILKAHGCSSAPGKIVLSRSSYFEARRKNPEFFSILNSLFLVNTVLFVGCSLTDPDIQLILENVNLSAPSLHPHYAIVPCGRHASLISSIEKTYNIRLLEYDDPSHAIVPDLIGELKNAVLDRRTAIGMP